MRVQRVATGVVLVISVLLSCRGPSPTKSALSPQEVRAVAAAERFVSHNGYVDQPADPKVVEWDIMDSPMPGAGITPEVILERRRNTVLAQAYGLSRSRGGKSGWTVYFEYNPAFFEGLPKEVTERSDQTGRAVEVSEDLTELHMPHMDIFLRTAEVVLRPPGRGEALKR